MGKQPSSALVEWQRAAKQRLLLVLDRRFHGNQTRLAQAMGVSQAYVNILARGVQPPTRNAMARLGAIEVVQAGWAATGDGDPFTSDVRGTLPVSAEPLPGPPADHAGLLNGERYAVSPEFDRATCYFWRVPNDHPAVAVAEWRLLAGDLVLLETSRTVIESDGGLHRKWCVVSGECLDRAEPVYGRVVPNEQGRMVLRTDRPILRVDDERLSPFVPPATSTPTPPKRPWQGERRRTIRSQAKLDRQAAERATDPWFQLPGFWLSQVVAVQLLMVRP